MNWHGNDVGKLPITKHTSLTGSLLLPDRSTFNCNERLSSTKSNVELLSQRGHRLDGYKLVQNSRIASPLTFFLAIPRLIGLMQGHSATRFYIGDGICDCRTGFRLRRAVTVSCSSDAAVD